jgi:hypothetical protein
LRRSAGRKNVEGVPENLEIEEDELGGVWLEAYLYLDPIAAYLCLQTGIPEPTIRAHIIAAAGHCKRPPKAKELVFMLHGDMYAVDMRHLRAMRRVIFDFVPKVEVDMIVGAYLADPFGEPGSIAFNQLENDIHFSVVRAVLEELNARGQLPLHPSHYF